MPYYQIDSLALGSARNNSVATLCESLMDALNGLREVRLDDSRPPLEWVAALRNATRDALLLFDKHVESALGHRPAVHTTSCRNTTALRELHAEHASIRAALESQFAISRDPGSSSPGGAVRLLDIAVDTECLLALHINGLVSLVRGSITAPSASFMQSRERVGASHAGGDR